jgi:hypothetical protein
MPLPIERAQAHDVARWMKSNFGDALRAATRDTPFSVDLMCGIVCQETAYAWLSFKNKIPVAEVLARCVLDASGDAPGHPRTARPRNTAEFRSRYGDAFADMLIAEANKTRKLRGMGPKKWVYKGYGLFQYDLQYVKTDQGFFKNRKWGTFDICLEKALGELKTKYKIDKDLWSAVRRYNGSGPKAVEYANNVFTYTRWCAEVHA